MQSRQLAAANEQLLQAKENQTHLITELRTLEEKMSNDMLSDPLTGLLSRKVFEDRLQLTVNQSLRHQLIFSVMFLDLDGFKIINDALVFYFCD